MHGLKIVPGEVVRGGNNSRATIYEQTIAATGTNPDELFREKPVNQGGNCCCGWVGHKTYSFSGLGGNHARIGNPSGSS